MDAQPGLGRGTRRRDRRETEEAARRDTATPPRSGHVLATTVIVVAVLVLAVPVWRLLEAGSIDDPGANVAGTLLQIAGVAFAAAVVALGVLNLRS